MFVRRKYSPDRKRASIQIVQSTRVGGQVRQKILRHVGVAHNEEDIQRYVAFAEDMIEDLKRETSPQASFFTPEEYRRFSGELHRKRRPRALGVDVGHCRERARLAVGTRNVFGEVYADMGWDRTLGSRRPAANRILRELVLARLSAPRSKRKTVENLARDVGISLNLDQVYQTMDRLDEKTCERIRRDARREAAMLRGGTVDVLFYDCTTLSFATEREDAGDGDGLLAKGYSKDGRHHRSQVLLAMTVTRDGLPIDYELFPGNTWEGNTLRTALEKLDADHGRDLGRVTLVADAAMMSAGNRALLEERAMPSILGYPMRRAPAAVREAILDREGYRPWVGRGDADVPEGGLYKEIGHGGGRIVATWSPARARNDVHKRGKAIEKLRKNLAGAKSPAKVSRQGYARFLSFSKAGEVEIDEDKIAEAARWDGLHAVVAHGHDDMPAEDILDRYRQLWQIEASFRLNKHDLKIRPVYHWTPRRIRAHVAICFMAFCCLQHLRVRLRMAGHPMSHEHIMEELNGVQVSIMERIGGDGLYAMPGRASKDAAAILRHVDLAWSGAAFEMEPPGPRKKAPTTA